MYEKVSPRFSFMNACVYLWKVMFSVYRPMPLVWALVPSCQWLARNRSTLWLTIAVRCLRLRETTVCLAVVGFQSSISWSTSWGHTSRSRPTSHSFVVALDIWMVTLACWVILLQQFDFEVPVPSRLKRTPMPKHSLIWWAPINHFLNGRLAPILL